MVCEYRTNRIQSNWTYIHRVCEWHIHITKAFMGSRWRPIAKERAKEREIKRDLKYRRVDRLWLRAPHKHCLKTTTKNRLNPHISCLEFFFVLTFISHHSWVAVAWRWFIVSQKFCARVSLQRNLLSFCLWHSLTNKSIWSAQNYSCLIFLSFFWIHAATVMLHTKPSQQWTLAIAFGWDSIKVEDF